MKFIAAIDGPAGTGKSSVARYLAQNLHFVYVDTGAIYRGLAFLVEKYQVEVEDVDDIVALIPKMEILVDEQAFCTRIKLDKMPVEKELRTEKISKLASLISQHKKVRVALLDVQRQLIHKITNGAIFEGRDIGTVVFPFAPLKIFITANSETRAKRRYEEIKNHHPDVSYQDILQAIVKRDDRDEKRANSPMQQAIDAHVIDTSDMTLLEVIEKAKNLIVAAYKNYQAGNKLW